MIARYISWQNFFDLGWLLFLVFMFIYFWRDRRSMLQMRLWRKASGRITHCEWTHHGNNVWPKIEYVYHIDEREYWGEHLFHDNVHNNTNSAYARKVAYQVACAYKDSGEIDIYYNPENPEQAVLDVHIPWKINFILLFVAGLIALHLVMMALKLVA